MMRNGSQEDGHVRSECQEDEGTDCNMKIVTPVGKGRHNLTCFLY
jgi:hypothetical protein